MCRYCEGIRSPNCGAAGNEGMLGKVAADGELKWTASFEASSGRRRGGVVDPKREQRGCRALLVDKDKNPKWEPSRLDLVDDKRIDVYFSKVNDEAWEDLKLPERSSAGVGLGSKL
ncbi:putative 3-hydroxyisobutyryl-CoA hydrolase 2 [Platanthera guangdongensis]|uniref:3-hydroxyisobutyryl-CoA hydrolase n=1 Tax=Platanthera guangdongensis TaxID=2320717 RepID=A0ABR2LNV0_9ASPA